MELLTSKACFYSYSSDERGKEGRKSRRFLSALPYKTKASVKAGLEKLKAGGVSQRSVIRSTPSGLPNNSMSAPRAANKPLVTTPTMALILASMATGSSIINS